MSKKDDKILDKGVDAPDYSKILKEIEEANENIGPSTINIKTAIIREFPFLSFMLMSCRFLYTYNIETCAATYRGGDAPVIMYNPHFYMKELKNDGERGFVMIHELLHLFLQHIGRGKEHNYHAKLWNVSTDLMINLLISDLKSPSLERPSMALYDERWRGMSADEIYHKLLEEADGDPDKACENAGAGDGGEQIPIDKVSSEEVPDSVKNEIKQKMAASMAAGKDSVQGIGHNPSDLERLFGDLLEPVIPWTEILQQAIITSSAGNETYDRIDRKSNVVIFPTYEGDHCSALIGIDTSGSMSSEDLAAGMTEIQSIMEMFDSWNIKVLTCDTEASVIGEYSSDEGDDISSVGELIGGGGTDMQPLIDYAGEHYDDEYSVNIIFTDGHIPEVSNDTDVPCVLVVIPGGNQNVEEVVSGDIQVIHMN